MLCTILGVGEGVGAALARQCATNGYHVALIARTDRVTRPLSERLEGEGLRAAPFIDDSGDVSAINRVLLAIKQWGGDTDVLIYNAAVVRSGMASEMTAEKVLSDMTTNLGGAICAVRGTIGAMKTRRSGSILLTGGGLAREPYPQWTLLAADKAALRAYGLALHKEAAFHGVHVAVVAICGIVKPGGLFDPQHIAEVYWELHCEPVGSFTREIVLLPEGGDTYYNDPKGVYRAMSYPIQAARH